LLLATCAGILRAFLKAIPLARTTNMEKIKNYILKATNGKIAQALCKRCAQGEIGESLLRSGLSQSAFVLFIAKEAMNQSAKGKTAEQLADILTLLSAGNASAAKQALADCTIELEGEKPQSVSAFWGKNGGPKTAINLSLLD